MRILKFKAKIEAELEADKWTRVANMTEEDGGKVMTAREARLRFKEIERCSIHASAADSDYEVTEADMDAIDRELAVLGDVSSSNDLSDSEQSHVYKSMELERDGHEEGRAKELTQSGQKFMEIFGEATRLDEVQFDIAGRPVKVVTVEGGALVAEGSLRLGQEDLEHNKAPAGESGMW